MKTDLLMAWRNIWRNTRRSWLTMGAISFACALLVFVLSFQIGSYQTMIRSTLDLATGHLQVQAEGYHDEGEIRQVIEQPQAVAERLDRGPSILAYAPRAEAFALASSQDRSYGIMLEGIDPALEPKVTKLHQTVTEGEYLSPGDGEAALVGQTLAENLKVGLGDEIVILGSGRDGSVAATVLTVKGIFQTGQPEIDRRSLQMPLATFQEVFFMRGAVHRIVLKTEHLFGLGRLEGELESAFAELPGPEGRLAVLTWQELVPGLIEAIQLDLAAGVLMYLILILVVVFSIFNTFIMVIFERQREFGVMLSMGVTPGRLSFLLMVESVVLTFLGLAGGIVIGSVVTLWLEQTGIPMGSAQEIAQQFGLPSRLYPDLSLVTALAGPAAVFLLTCLAALYPVLKVQRLKPVEALNAI